MKKRHVKFLKKLLETPSPTGFEVPVANFVRSHMTQVADAVVTDTMGSVHATLDGEQNGLHLMLSTHMDEIGLMVTYISEEGFLSVAAVGGVDPAVLPGMRMDVLTDSGVLRGIVGRKPIHLIDNHERKAVTQLDKLVIDVGLPGKEVKKRVRIGDYITFGVGFERFGKNMAVSRAFDDKIGVFIACRVMEELSAKGLPYGSFSTAITVQEEIGVRGASTSAYSLYPDVAIAFDVTHATDYPGIDKAKYGDLRCGGGPVIARGPNINPLVYERLVAAAEELGIPYQMEAEPSVTGTDARAIQITRDGIPTGLVSIPLRYMHTPTEVISLKDVQATIKLLVRFAENLEPDAGFVPGLDEAPAPVVPRDEEADYTNEMKELIAMTEEANRMNNRTPRGAIVNGVDAEPDLTPGANNETLAREMDDVTIEYHSDSEVMEDTKGCVPATFDGGNNSDAPVCMPEDESLRPEL